MKTLQQAYEQGFKNPLVDNPYSTGSVFQRTRHSAFYAGQCDRNSGYDYDDKAVA